MLGLGPIPKVLGDKLNVKLIAHCAEHFSARKPFYLDATWPRVERHVLPAAVVPKQKGLLGESK